MKKFHHCCSFVLVSETVAGNGFAQKKCFYFNFFFLQVHRKYTGEDFDEDLRTVLRRSGCKNEKIAFIMDESNVLDSGFLERMNTLLANGEVRIRTKYKTVVFFVCFFSYLPFHFLANNFD